MKKFALEKQGILLLGILLHLHPILYVAIQKAIAMGRESSYDVNIWHTFAGTAIGFFTFSFLLCGFLVLLLRSGRVCLKASIAGIAYVFGVCLCSWLVNKWLDWLSYGQAFLLMGMLLAMWIVLLFDSMRKHRQK